LKIGETDFTVDHSQLNNMGGSL